MKISNSLLSLLFVLLFCVDLSAQQGLFWQLTTNDKPTYQVRERQHRNILDYQNSDSSSDNFTGFSLHKGSYYAGAGTTFIFNETSDSSFLDQFTVNANLTANFIQPVTLGSLTINFPFAGNIQALIFNNDPSTTIEAGLYPFGQIKESNPGYDATIHALFEGRMEPVKEGFTESTRSYNFGLGMDFAFYIKENTKPFALGFAFLYQRQTRMDAVDAILKENAFGLEGTAIYQIAPGFGVTFQGYLDISGFRESGFRTGIALIGGNKGN